MFKKLFFFYSIFNIFNQNAFEIIAPGSGGYVKQTY